MGNFAQLTNYYNRIDAWKDWESLAKQANDLGMSDEANRLQPRDNARWQTIEKRSDKLRSKIEANHD